MVYFEETCALIPADADKGILGAEIAHLRIVDGVGCTVVYLVASEVVVDAQPSVTVLAPVTTTLSRGASTFSERLLLVCYEDADEDKE